MPRFVVLYHETLAEPATESDDVSVGTRNRPTHWDLMLEDGNVLLTWEVTAPLEVGTSALIQRLPDHRLKYLDYEGALSNNRGSVTRVHSGTFEWVQKESTKMVAVLSGDLSGQISLETEHGEFEETNHSETLNSEQWWRMNFVAKPDSKLD